MSVLAARDVHVVYGSRARAVQALRGVSVTVAPERSIGLAGESGSGKSTLARVLVGMQPQTSGTVTWDGRPLVSLPRSGSGARPRVVQLVFQDPMSSLNPKMTAGQAIGEALAVNRIPVEDQQAEVARLLDMVGLSSTDSKKFPFQFSGGQRQRVALARAVAVRPAVLVCDEMTSALDVSAQAVILNLLRDIRTQTGLGLAVVSHNLDVIRYLCDDVHVMRDGQVIESGPTMKVFDDPQETYTRQLVAAIPRFSVTPRRQRA